jgi:opacity protein-like surface antigen
LFEWAELLCRQYLADLVGLDRRIRREFAISGNVSLKAEYLYTNLGHINVDSSAAVAPVARFTADFGRVVFGVVRAGLNYKF